MVAPFRVSYHGEKKKRPERITAKTSVTITPDLQSKNDEDEDEDD